MASIGDFITKEYELSKKILENLPISDLLNARRVCRDWCRVANRILKYEFSTAPFVYFSKCKPRSKQDFEHWNNSRVLPDVVIKFYSTNQYSGKGHEIINNHFRRYVWEPVFYSAELSEELAKDPDFLELPVKPTLLNLHCDGCFSVSKLKGQPRKVMMCKSFNRLSGAFDGSAFAVFPKVPGVYCSPFHISFDYDANYDSNDEEEVDFHLEELNNNSNGPVRCVLLYENYPSEIQEDVIVKFITYLFRTIYKQQDEPFAFGGGKLRETKLLKDCVESSCDVCGVIIRGENVVAHSTIMKGDFAIPELDTFMDKLSKWTGPTPQNAHRIALMAQCIDRPRYYNRLYRRGRETETVELESFMKYFPNVPACGFLAGGEFGVIAATHQDAPNYTSASVPKKKKLKLMRSAMSPEEFLHCQTTSIVIITYLNTTEK